MKAKAKAKQEAYAIEKLIEKSMPTIKEQCFKELHEKIDEKLKHVTDTYHKHLQHKHTDNAWMTWNKAVTEAFIEYFRLTGNEAMLARRH